MLIKKTVQSLFLTTLSTTSIFAGTPINHTERYLDPSIWTLTVKENDCFSAAPQSLLQVEPVIENGYRNYKISQVFDTKQQRELYAQSITDQTTNHRIIAREFCGGIASISTMDLPFTKSIRELQDANDGLLLTNKLRHGVAEVQEHLIKMTMLAAQASSGTNSSSQLEELDKLFKMHLSEIDHITQTTVFNGIKLFNGSYESLYIPINGSLSFIEVPLCNLTVGSVGLNMASPSLTSLFSSQNTLSSLQNSSVVDRCYADIKTSQIKLENAAKQDADITMVDVRTDDFIVQHQTDSLSLKKHR